MSRCFPYPPPGYYPKGERNEALIESSIKLQKGREKAKEESKKERIREKKHKKRESKVDGVREFGHGEKKRKRKDEKVALKEEKVLADLEGKYFQKRGEDEAEQLERSNLTEEHGHPISLQIPCYSSDSTENSNKRRRHTSPANGIRRTHGNILRIRLPSLKLKEPDASVNEAQLCSSSKPIQEECRSSEADLCRRDENRICSTSRETENFAHDNSRTTTTVSNSGHRVPTVESLFKDLVENWVSPPVQSERTDLDELEWLFERKLPVRERAKASSNVLCNGNTHMWPRAHYVPEADIYALPFTVPF